MEKMNFFDKSSETPILKNKSDLAQKLNGRVEPAFGIDLGTTNSAISVIINNNKPEQCLPVYSGMVVNKVSSLAKKPTKESTRLNTVSTQSNVRCRILTTQEHLAMVAKALQ